MTSTLFHGGTIWRGADQATSGAMFAREGVVEASQHLQQPDPLQQGGKAALLLDLGQACRALVEIDLFAEATGDIHTGALAALALVLFGITLLLNAIARLIMQGGLSKLKLWRPA